MTTPSYHVLFKEEHRLHAVMALFRGEKTSEVSMPLRRNRLHQRGDFTKAAIRTVCGTGIT
jgi:hypothetical protein